MFCSRQTMILSRSACRIWWLSFHQNPVLLPNLISYAAIRTKIKCTNIFQHEIFTRVSYTTWGAYEIKTARIITYEIFSTRNITKLRYLNCTVYSSSYQRSLESTPHAYLSSSIMICCIPLLQLQANLRKTCCNLPFHC